MSEAPNPNREAPSPNREVARPNRDVRLPGGLTLRALIPNAITASALAFGLTGIRFAIAAASGEPAVAVPGAGLPLGDWEKAVLAVILAGMLMESTGASPACLKRNRVSARSWTAWPIRSRSGWRRR